MSEITFRQKFIECIPHLKAEYFEKKGMDCDMCFVDENFAMHCELVNREFIDGIEIVISRYIDNSLLLGNRKSFEFKPLWNDRDFNI